MSTWFTTVLNRLPKVLFDIRIEDQDHSARLLREGAVMGAVTTERSAVPGCRVQPLGVMRYLQSPAPPMPSAIYQRDSPRGCRGGTLDRVEPRRRTGRICWCAKRFDARCLDRCITLPTAEGFGAAVGAGLGWGMYPEQLPHPNSLMARSSEQPISTLMCRCSGNAGNSTVH